MVDGYTSEAIAAPGARRGLLYRLLANPLSATGMFMVITAVLVALLAPFIAPYDPIALALEHRLQAPSDLHWFGTDENGRDILSRVIFGARYSLFAAFGILALAALAGSLIGLVAGLFGGWLDELLMRIT